MNYRIFTLVASLVLILGTSCLSADEPSRMTTQSTRAATTYPVAYRVARRPRFRNTYRPRRYVYYPTPQFYYYYYATPYGIYYYAPPMYYYPQRGTMRIPTPYGIPR